MVVSSVPEYVSVRVADSKPLVRFRPQARRTNADDMPKRNAMSVSCDEPVMLRHCLYSAVETSVATFDPVQLMMETYSGTVPVEVFAAVETRTMMAFAPRNW